MFMALLMLLVVKEVKNTCCLGKNVMVNPSQKSTLKDTIEIKHTEYLENKNTRND